MLPTLPTPWLQLMRQKPKPMFVQFIRNESRCDRKLSLFILQLWLATGSAVGSGAPENIRQ